MWPRDLSRDFINYHIQRHSTKSTNRTCLSPCSWRLTFLIHQILSIYYWKANQALSYLLRSTLSNIILTGVYFSSSSSAPALQLLSSRLYMPFLDQTPSRNQKSLVTKCTTCWTQPVRALKEVNISIHSVFKHGFYLIIDPVTMKEVWSLRVNDKALRDNSRIVGTWSALKPKKLSLETFNKMLYWETD